MPHLTVQEIGSHVTSTCHDPWPRKRFTETTQQALHISIYLLETFLFAGFHINMEFASLQKLFKNKVYNLQFPC